MGGISAAEARQIGLEGYIYFYPLITMELTRRQMTNGPAGARLGQGPMGQFSHARAYPPADFKAVVRPNFDTLYSITWLDVSDEPMIVSAPSSGGRYYMLPCYDMWTDAFAVPGTRTSGNGAFSFALALPDWSGTLPEGVERIDAPTPDVWIIGRTQTNGPADYDAVHEFQDQLQVTPLSHWGAQAPAPVPNDDPSVDMVTPPMEQVHALSAADYFSIASQVVQRHAPHPTDWGMLARLRRIGFRVGETYELAAQDQVVQDALAQVPVEAVAELRRSLPIIGKVTNGWLVSTDTMGVYGDYYLKRAVVCLAGLGANQADDAVYPVLLTDADGRPLDGSNSYVIHFDADKLPPADAFWSVTMYDADGFQAANELDRFAIGDRDALTFNPDGSLDLFLQHENPGPQKVSNWLPSPEGPIGATLRLYLPRPEVLTGKWVPPAVQRVQ